jgi:glycosyltransferase involved in cell wall biosynthesis
MLASISRRSISVFFPAFNDARTIPSLVTQALDVLLQLTDDYEVLVINDGSTDQTAAIIDELADTLPHVRAIHHQNNLGYGATLQTGFSQASKDLIFYTDGDGQYDVLELKRLVPLMTDEIDVVNGYKGRRADDRRRKVLGAIYNRGARIFFNLPIRDVDCDFRLIRRQALVKVSRIAKSGAACVELIHRLQATGAVFAETEVSHYPRRFGKSQFFTLSNVARTLFDFALLLFRFGLETYVLGVHGSKRAPFNAHP